MANTLKPYVKSPTVITVQDVDNELLRIQEAFELISRYVMTEITYVKPDKPVELQTLYADGTKWNPGQGAGFYIYINRAWKKVTMT